MAATLFLTALALHSIAIPNMLRIAEGEGSTAVREPKRGPNSLDGKSEIKKPTLNTPTRAPRCRYEYNDVYIHMVTKPGLLRWTHLSGDVCV